MAASLDVDVYDRNDWTVIAVLGEVDLATAPRLESLFGEHVKDGARIVVDLQGVSFMDSTGLRVLIAAHRQLDERAGQFAVVPGSGAVARLLDLTGVDQQMSTHDSVSSATNG